MANAHSTQDIVTVHVQAAMAVLGRTQKQLAAALAMHPSGVTHRFRGHPAWSSHEIDKLAEYFGSSVADLVTDSPDFLQRLAEAEFDRRSTARRELVSAGVQRPEPAPAIGTGRNRRRSAQRIGGAVITLPLPRTSFEQVAA